MLDRVDMDVVHMTRKIFRIADGVLPITPLPDTAFALRRDCLKSARRLEGCAKMPI
jgi:hypothetical protein